MRSCPNVQGVFGSRAVSGRFRAWRAGSARVSTLGGAQAVSWTRRCRRPCMCGLRVGILLWQRPLDLTRDPPHMAAATARPGTERSRPMPTPPAGVYVAVMPFTITISTKIKKYCKMKSATPNNTLQYHTIIKNIFYKYCTNCTKPNNIRTISNKIYLQYQDTILYMTLLHKLFHVLYNIKQYWIQYQTNKLQYCNNIVTLQ